MWFAVIDKDKVVKSWSGMPTSQDYFVLMMIGLVYYYHAGFFVCFISVIYFVGLFHCYWQLSISFNSQRYFIIGHLSHSHSFFFFPSWTIISLIIINHSSFTMTAWQYITHMRYFTITNKDSYNILDHQSPYHILSISSHYYTPLTISTMHQIQHINNQSVLTITHISPSTLTGLTSPLFISYHLTTPPLLPLATAMSTGESGEQEF